MYIASVVTDMCCSEMGIFNDCVYCLSLTSGIIFNPSAAAITDHSQSAKNIDQYFKSVKDPVALKTGTHFIE